MVTSKFPDDIQQLIEDLYNGLPSVKVAAAQKLAKSTNIIAREALLRAMKGNDEENWEVRWVATSALGDTGDLSLVPVLLEALYDKERGIREPAIIALGQLGDVSVVPDLLKFLNWYSMSDLVARSLAQLGDHQAIPPLIALLEEIKPQVETKSGAFDDVSEAIIDALLTFGTKEALVAVGKWRNPDMSETEVVAIIEEWQRQKTEDK